MKQLVFLFVVVFSLNGYSKTLISSNGYKMYAGIKAGDEKKIIINKPKLFFGGERVLLRGGYREDEEAFGNFVCSEFFQSAPVRVESEQTAEDREHLHPVNRVVTFNTSGDLVRIVSTWSITSITCERN